MCLTLWDLVAQWLLTLCDSMQLACQASLSMGVSRQEYWSGLSCHPQGDLPNPGIQPRSPALQADSLLTEPPGTHTPTLQRSLGCATSSGCTHLPEISSLWGRALGCLPHSLKPTLTKGGMSPGQWWSPLTELGPSPLFTLRPWPQTSWSCPSCRWGDWDSERWKNLPKAP